MPSNVRLSNQIYLMKCLNFAKVGISNDVVKRMNAIYTSQPFNIELIHSVSYPSILIQGDWYLNTAFLIEQKLHQILIDKNLLHRGEWFNDFEKTSDIYMSFVLENTPEFIGKIAKLFIDACQVQEENKKLFRQKMKEKFKKEYTNILPKVSKKNPRSLDFLKSEEAKIVIEISKEI